MLNNKVIQILLNNIYPISLYCRQIAGTVVILFLARFLSVYDYGIFTSYKAQAAFLLLFANLGYNEYVLVSSQKVIRDVQLKIGLFVINAISILLLIGICSMFVPLESKYIFILVLIRTFLDNTFFFLILPYFQAAKKFSIISLVNIFYSAMMILITIVSYIYHFSLAKFLWCNIALGIVNFIQVSFYAKVNYLLVITHIKELIKKIDKSIFAYVGVLLCSYLYSQIPSLYSSIFVTKEDAALYFSSFTIASIICLLIIAQVQKIIPELMKTSVSNIKNILKTNLFVMNSINIFIFILFIFAGKDILNLIYGQDYYSGGYIMLLILTFSNISIAVASIYGAYITASGNQKMKIKMQVEAILISLITLAVLDSLGIYAAAIAYFLSATHIGIRYTHRAKQLLKQQEILENKE